METKLIHITSGKGPAECCLAVALCLKEIISEAVQNGISYEVVSRSPGDFNMTLESATLKVQGKNLEVFLQSWTGSLLWISQSPYRKFHKRKNWFIGISELNCTVRMQLDEHEITFQTMRSQGPGGQNVNKTETAVRAIHRSSGLFSVCNSHRSQLQNKSEAMERLKEKYALWQQNKLMEEGHASTFENNNNLSRGNPKRVYQGEKFKRQ